MKNPDTKICVICGDTFERPSDYSQTQWATRKACSKRCAHKASQLKKTGEVMAVRIGLQSAMDAVASAMTKWRRCL